MKDALTKKLGPLPVWGWAVLIALALVVLVILKNRNAAAASTAASNLTPPTIFQFVPPVQEDEDNEDTDPDKHHRRHRRRKHPAGDRDRDDSKSGPHSPKPVTTPGGVFTNPIRYPRRSERAAPRSGRQVSV